MSDNPDSAPGASRAPVRTRARMESLRLRIVGEFLQVADLLAQGKTPRQAAHVLAVERGYSRDTADRTVAATLRMLQGDGVAEPLESKRARIVAMCQAGFEACMARERGFMVSVGKGEDGKNMMALEKVPDPDGRAAAKFAELLARIELGV